MYHKKRYPSYHTKCMTRGMFLLAKSYSGKIMAIAL